MFFELLFDYISKHFYFLDVYIPVQATHKAYPENSKNKGFIKNERIKNTIIKKNNEKLINQIIYNYIFLLIQFFLLNQIYEELERVE